MKKILAISGSLRAESANTAVLRAVQEIIGEQATVVFYNGYDQLPHFNTEQDVEPAPAAVTEFRNLLKSSAGVVICTPEYAFGMPGSLKNALDWTVSSGEFNEKPVAVISASPLPSGGNKALAALLLVCAALGTTTPESITLSVPAIKVKMNEKGELADEPTLNSLRKLSNEFLQTIG